MSGSDELREIVEAFERAWAAANYAESTAADAREVEHHRARLLALLEAGARYRRAPLIQSSRVMDDAIYDAALKAAKEGKP